MRAHRVPSQSATDVFEKREAVQHRRLAALLHQVYELSRARGLEHACGLGSAVALLGLGDVLHHVPRHCVPVLELRLVELDELAVLLCESAITETQCRARVHRKLEGLRRVRERNLRRLECVLNRAPGCALWPWFSQAGARPLKWS